MTAAPTQAQFALHPELDEAIALGELRMAEAFDAAHDRWCAAVEEWICRLRPGETFIAEDAVLAVDSQGYTTGSAKAVGSIVRALARRRLIQPTGAARRARTSHGSLKPEWRRTGEPVLSESAARAPVPVAPQASGVDAKSHRLLGEGAVQVIVAHEHRVSARVRSDHHGIVDVQWSRFDGWRCTCPAYGRCSHIEAVARVTTRSPKRAKGA